MRSVAERSVRSNLARAMLLWLVAMVISVGLWSAVMVETDSDPLNYAYANSYLQAEARGGSMPRAEADHRLAVLRWQLFHWIVTELRIPLLYSLLTIPLLAWLMSRANGERWIVTWLAIGLAVIVPVVAAAPSPLHEVRSASAPASAVRTGGTPVATPILDAGSR